MNAPVGTIDGVVTPQVLREMMRDGAELAVLDARGEQSFSQAHLLFATCLPLGRIELDAACLLPRRSVRVVWCDDGSGLARRAALRLRALGYDNVSTLDGGTEAWRTAGLPLYWGVHVPSKAFAEVVEHECGTPWISAEELNERLTRGDAIRVFDSRSFEEYRNNTIPGATSLPGAELVYRIHDLVPAPETLVVVNCGGRTRSIIGAQALINAGVPNRVVSLRNGTMGWHLAGFPVSRGAVLQAGEPSSKALERAARAAESVAGQLGIRCIDMPTLAAWRDEIESRTLYVLDVRSPEEYQAGHLPGALSAPGGQLVQETDNWLAVWGARVVLVDDRHLVRARMTASWLMQMGWTDTATLAWDPARDPVETGFPASMPLGLDSVAHMESRAVTPALLADRLKSAASTVVDVGSSKNYRKGHIPGAYFVTRVRLPEHLAKLPSQGPLVVTSEDGMLGRFAAADLVATTGRDAQWLRGGTQAWAATALPLEEGDARLIDEPDDVWYAPRERSARPEEGMVQYLDWEIELVNQIARDPDNRIRIARLGRR